MKKLIYSSKNLSLLKKSILLLRVVPVFICILFTLNVRAGVQATYYVSPAGSDNNPGTIDQPFATMQKARDVVRAINGNMTGDIIVNIRGGTYELDSAFTLTSADNGTNGYNIVYKGYNCETAVISGGKRITGWSIHDAGKNIYQATVDISSDSRQLYVNGNRAVRARSADASGWSESGDGYTCPSTVATWGNITNVEVVSFSAWKCHRGPIASAGGTHAVMAQPYWGLLHTQYNAPPTWIENAYELLDSEGEWYLDRSTATLYYKPRAGEDMATAEVILPKLETLISGSGVNNVQFSGLTFSHTTWLYPNSIYGFPCLQSEAIFIGANWAAMQLPGNITFNYCQNLRLEGNTFEHLGISGLQLYRGCKNNVVYDNTFRDISGSAVTIGSFVDANASPADLVKDNTVDNNLITRAAVEYFGCVGVFVAYTEHTVLTHNEISYLPYSGISMGWGWSNVPTVAKNNEIGYNLIDSVMMTLMDGGAIYTLSAQAGTQVHDNYIHHQFHEYGSLYPDEGSSYMHWHHNVVRSVTRWLHMWTSSIQNDTVDYNYYDNATQTTNGTNCIIQNNVYVTGGNWPPAALSIMNNSGRSGVTQPTIAVNLALNKIASCTSFYDPTHVASKGNDDVTGTCWASDGVEANPWWQVDLVNASKIVKVELMARQDLDQAGARTNFEIWASNVSDFSTHTVLGSYTGTPFPAYATWSLNVSDQNTYRYIRAQRINNGGHFNFAELRIYDSTSVATVSVKNVCLSPTSLTLFVSNTSQLTATVLPNDATNQNVNWSSGDTTIATVSPTGLVTAKAIGIDTVTVSTQDGNKTAACIVTVTNITGISPDQSSSDFAIYPNPAMESTNILYSLPGNSHVSITVFDMMGKRIIEVINEKQIAGEHLATLNTAQLPDGIYFVSITSDSKTLVRRMIKQ